MGRDRVQSCLFLNLDSNRTDWQTIVASSSKDYADVSLACKVGTCARNKQHDRDCAGFSKKITSM